MKKLMKARWYGFLFWLLPGYTNHILEVGAKVDQVVNDAMETDFELSASLEFIHDGPETTGMAAFARLLIQNPAPGEDVRAFEDAAKKRVMEIFWECKKKGMVNKDELVKSGFDFVTRKLNCDGGIGVFGRVIFAPVAIFAKAINETIEVGYHPGHAEICFAILDDYAYVTSYVPEKGGELWKG